MRSPTMKWWSVFGRSVLLTVIGLTSVVASAHAVTQSELLARFSSKGPAAGHIGRSSAIATDPDQGYIFVVGGENHRVDEFTPWGNFVKAFGWDVAPAGVNEQQEVTVKATAGQFTLTFGASTTGDIAHDASAEAVASALNGLSSISAGGGSVSVSKGASDSSSSRYVVAFSGGSLREADIAQMSAADGTIPLSGGNPTGVRVSTRADGTAPTTGFESCTAESGCQAGSSGTGAGQFLTFGPGLTVDSEGNVFVSSDGRVQKFDSSGRFLLMWGGEVNKTTKADICTAGDLNSGDECGGGVVGNGPGQLSRDVSELSVGPTGSIFAAGDERIEEFEPDGSFVRSIPVPGKDLQKLSIDPNTGDLYATSGSDIFKLDPLGTQLCQFSVPAKFVFVYIATDISGNLYVSYEGSIQNSTILEFDGSCPLTRKSEFTLALVSGAPVAAWAIATNTAGDLLLARNTGGNGSASFLDIYGPPPVQFEPPPQVAPEITAQFATSVDPEDATVAANVNPRFWTDTRYYVEYGTGKCSEGGCEEIKPSPPGSLLTKAVTSSSVTSAGVLLEGLRPATTYHYRFVAQSGGGGPVKGAGGTLGADGAEGTFRTPPLPGSPETNCPNQVFRTGPSAQLPDCRAYEMVSPLDKNNGDIRSTLNLTGIPIGLQQSATDGESFTYTSYRAFADPASGAVASQYLASRSAGGWTSQNLAPPHRGFTLLDEIAGLENEFKGFSSDLCSAWLIVPSPPAPAPGGPEDYPGLYRRQNCPSTYEVLTPTGPAETLPSTFHVNQIPEPQGYSADGSRAIFIFPTELAKSPANRHQLFESHAGTMSPVCILPEAEAPISGDCSAGTGGAGLTYYSTLTHAISEDGSRIYWTASREGPGKIYVRVNGTETLPVSETQSSKAARFWAASADGSKALFEVEDSSTTKNENLYLFQLGEEEGSETPPIAGKVIGVVGQSDDLSYVYFVSKEAIGGEGTAGQPNLYLHHEGTNTFIGTLADADVNIYNPNTGALFSNVEPTPIWHTAQASPDGRHLSFFSTASLTGYDSADAASGEADAEVYRYAADGDKLDCVSCNPGGARPHGRQVSAPAGGELSVAALPPNGESQLYTPRALSADGSRLYFTAYDSLLPRDTNGVADVYEWEQAGAGSCTTEVPAFSPLNGGCVYLISSGTSPKDSKFLDVSEDGRDVFFTTDQSLLPPSQDPGLIDIYDARTQGGFPPPPSPPAACEGESCQGPYNPPNDPTPASSSFQGAGNVTEAKAKKKKRAKKASHKKQHKSKKSNGKGRRRAANRNGGNAR